jgi:hypothetical protein
MLDLLATCFTLDFCLTYPSTVKMEAICSSEASVDIEWSTLHYIPEHKTLPICPTLKVSRQCSIIHWADVRLIEGKALGSEKGKGIGLFMGRGKKLSRSFTAYDQNVYINVRSAALG